MVLLSHANLKNSNILWHQVSIQYKYFFNCNIFHFISISFIWMIFCSTVMRQTASFNRFWDYFNTLEDIKSEVTLLNENNLFLFLWKSYKFFLLNFFHCNLRTAIYSITGGSNPTAYIILIRSNIIFNISLCCLCTWAWHLFIFLIVPQRAGVQLCWYWSSPLFPPQATFSPIPRYR